MSNMISSTFAPSLSRRDTKSSISHDPSVGSMPPPLTSGSGSLGPQSAAAIYQHIHDMAAKRISTLGYLRKAHEGRIYWFNTVHFSRTDISRLPYFEPRKLARRAINYLLLGLSLPPILDVSTTPVEFLRALNTLLNEFEAFQQVHPPDGTSSSTLTRARIPQMFKRAVHAGTKARRTSSATEIGLPIQSSDPSDLKSMASNSASAAAATVSFPHTEASELLPGEEYTYLLTPLLPFEPDYFETFVTLCDILIDCYTRLVSLVFTPSVCTVALGEMFSKADAKIRKIMVAGIIREFEDASRHQAKSELNSVGRVVLGGLMG
ncbi:similar to An03g02750 [Aspergillus luchuensis]|uniref:Similar to An03g02750 n=1 Tax=Aspergillus kawachii TaxID=1069201 RepID=A0A146F3W6_ASPKA|nr:similar to An03g02750 [Aspergillus luchuensis]